MSGGATSAPLTRWSALVVFMLPALVLAGFEGGR
jgi:hypothetical protein